MTSVTDTVKWILGLPIDETRNPDTGPRYQDWKVRLPTIETVEQALANRKTKELLMAKVKNLSAKRRKKNPPLEETVAPPTVYTDLPPAAPVLAVTPSDANTIPKTLKTTIVSSKPAGK